MAQAGLATTTVINGTATNYKVYKMTMINVNDDDSQPTNDAQVIDNIDKPFDADYMGELAELLRDERERHPVPKFKKQNLSPSLDPTKIVQKQKNANTRPPVSLLANTLEKAASYIILDPISKNGLPARDRGSLSNTKSTGYKMSNLYNIHPNEHRFLLDS